MVAIDLRPLRIVEGEGFLSLLRYLEPGYKVTSVMHKASQNWTGIFNLMDFCCLITLIVIVVYNLHPQEEVLYCNNKG